MSGPTVAFQGAHGAFGEDAVRQRWHDGDPRPMPTFERVLESVDVGISDYGVLPVWNSVLGEIPFTRTALAGGGRVRVMEEIEVPVDLCLLALPGVPIDEIRYVGSHPAALGQCRRFFAAHPAMIPSPAWDTAGAARELARPWSGPQWHHRLLDATDATVGVIAGARAAERYGLAVLTRAIQDVAANFTHFVVLQRTGDAR